MSVQHKVPSHPKTASRRSAADPEMFVTRCCDTEAVVGRVGRWLVGCCAEKYKQAKSRQLVDDPSGTGGRCVLNETQNGSR